MGILTDQVRSHRKISLSVATAARNDPARKEVAPQRKSIEFLHLSVPALWQCVMPGLIPSDGVTMTSRAAHDNHRMVDLPMSRNVYTLRA